MLLCVKNCFIFDIVSNNQKMTSSHAHEKHPCSKNHIPPPRVFTPSICMRLFVAWRLCFLFSLVSLTVPPLYARLFSSDAWKTSDKGSLPYLVMCTFLSNRHGWPQLIYLVVDTLESGIHGDVSEASTISYSCFL